jgi:ribosomal protein S18 acetylase RimI-like enzyme
MVCMHANASDRATAGETGPETDSETHHESDELVEAIERATITTLAPRAVEELPGWLLPFDPTPLQRSRAAVPLRHRPVDLAILDTIDARYRAHDLPPRYRIADVPAFAPLREELTRRGLTPNNPALVQVAPLPALRALWPASDAPVSRRMTDEWRRGYIAYGGDPVKEQRRLEILERHDHSLFTYLREGDDIIAVGAAGIAFGFACGHSVRVSPQHRRRGLAGRIMGALVHAASPEEAESLQVMLQVEADNTGAVELYRRAGFVTLWQYTYWL